MNVGRLELNNIGEFVVNGVTRASLKDLRKDLKSYDKVVVVDLCITCITGRTLIEELMQVYTDEEILDKFVYILKGFSFYNYNTRKGKGNRLQKLDYTDDWYDEHMLLLFKMQLESLIDYIKTSKNKVSYDLKMAEAIENCNKYIRALCLETGVDYNSIMVTVTEGKSSFGTLCSEFKRLGLNIRSLANTNKAVKSIVAKLRHWSRTVRRGDVFYAGSGYSFLDVTRERIMSEQLYCVDPKKYYLVTLNSNCIPDMFCKQMNFVDYMKHTGVETEGLTDLDLYKAIYSESPTMKKWFLHYRDTVRNDSKSFKETKYVGTNEQQNFLKVEEQFIRKVKEKTNGCAFIYIASMWQFGFLFKNSVDVYDAIKLLRDVASELGMSCAFDSVTVGHVAKSYNGQYSMYDFDKPTVLKYDLLSGLENIPWDRHKSKSTISDLVKIFDSLKALDK